MAKKLVRYKNVNGVLVKQYESPALIDGLVDISQLPIVGAMGSAVIESGENGNGRWVKWADGTMICTHIITSTAWNIDPGTTASLGAWTYPAVFAEAPVVSCTFYGNGADFLHPTTMIPTTSGVSDYSLHNFHSSIFLPGSNMATYKFTAIGRWK